MTICRSVDSGIGNSNKNKHITVPDPRPEGLSSKAGSTVLLGQTNKNVEINTEYGLDKILTSTVFD